MVNRILWAGSLALGLSATACQSPSNEHSVFPVSQVSYAGDAACASCHEDQSTSFQSHGMANSFYPMSVDKVIEDFGGSSVYHAPTEYSYRAFREDDRFYQEETRVEEGDTKHRLVREITHVIGNGQEARTYLSESNGRFFELPLTWDSRKGEWALRPGYTNDRFDRKLTAKCTACHSDAPPVAGVNHEIFERAPLSISCERCHGSGLEHVSARLAVPNVDTEADPTIINPARLDLDLRLDVCQQCHLNGAVVMYPDGAGPYTFQPGDRLSDHQILFAPAHESGVDVVSHAERLKMSACFLESVDALQPLDCSTCHDPHSGFREDGPSYFNETCEDCHTDVQTTVAAASQEAHVSGANCISCHLTKRGIGDAPHDTYTDHFIRASIASDAPEPSGGGLLVLESLSEHSSDGELALAYLTYGWENSDVEALRRGVTLAEGAREELLAAGNSNGALLWGKTLLAAGLNDAAQEPLRVALAADTTDAERLHAIAKALQGLGDHAEAEVFYRRALAFAPNSVSILTDYGRFLQMADRSPEAEEHYRAAVAEEPWSVVARNGLSSVLADVGRLDEALAEVEKALELDPDHVDALTNLGTFLARSGDFERALDVLERAAGLGLQANNLTPFFNLGLVSLEVGDFDGAVQAFGQIVRLNSNNPHARVFLARAFMGLEDFSSAGAQVNAALNFDPENVAALTLKAELEARD